MKKADNLAVEDRVNTSPKKIIKSSFHSLIRKLLF